VNRSHKSYELQNKVQLVSEEDDFTVDRYNLSSPVPSRFVLELRLARSPA
jgi:hypothetical protein